jgi:phosphoribosylanthranilate isomerase
MMERYHRLRKLRIAWTYRNNLTELKLVQVTNELMAVENSIEDVEERLCRVDPRQVQFHDFAMTHLVVKTRERNSLNKNRETLKAIHHRGELNEHRCEKLETKQKAIIDKENLETQLLEVMENLRILRND